MSSIRAAAVSAPGLCGVGSIDAQDGKKLDGRRPLPRSCASASASSPSADSFDSQMQMPSAPAAANTSMSSANDRPGVVN